MTNTPFRHVAVKRKAYHDASRKPHQFRIVRAALVCGKIPIVTIGKVGHVSI